MSGRTTSCQPFGVGVYVHLARKACVSAGASCMKKKECHASGSHSPGKWTDESLVCRHFTKSEWMMGSDSYVIMYLQNAPRSQPLIQTPSTRSPLEYPQTKFIMNAKKTEASVLRRVGALEQEAPETIKEIAAAAFFKILEDEPEDRSTIDILSQVVNLCGLHYQVKQIPIDHADLAITLYHLVSTCLEKDDREGITPESCAEIVVNELVVSRTKIRNAVTHLIGNVATVASGEEVAPNVNGEKEQ